MARSLFGESGDPHNPRIFMTFKRKKLDKIDFKTAAKNKKQFTLGGSIRGRKRRITIIVRKHLPCPSGERVTVDILTTTALNRPQGELWLPYKREQSAGILTPPS